MSAPEVTGISGDLQQRGGNRAEEEVIQERGVAAAQWMKHVRQREDHVHVRHVEELTRREPSLARLRLTLWTVPVSTRVVRDRPMSAGATLIDMPTERGGAASCRSVRN